MFIRKKKIKGNEYAYLVANKYNKKKGQSRQKSLTYLGRIIRFPESKDQINAKSINQSITNELAPRGFEQKNKQLIRGGIVVDVQKARVTKLNKPACLEINQGFLCAHTLHNLLNFQPPKSTNSDVAKAFASAFVNAGININQDSFISIFNNKFKNIKD